MVLKIDLKKSPISWLISLLILAGDVETNPGPTKFPCGVCSRPCKKNQDQVQCDTCDQWFHKKCFVINPTNWKALVGTNISWHCTNCALPNFSSSLFNEFNEPSPSRNPFANLSSLPDSPPPAHLAHTPYRGSRGPGCAHQASHCTQPPLPSPPPTFRPHGASTPKKPSYLPLVIQKELHHRAEIFLTPSQTLLSTSRALKTKYTHSVHRCQFPALTSYTAQKHGYTNTYLIPN